MASNSDAFIVQLEDALLKGAPIIGGLIGALLFVSFVPLSMGFWEKFFVGALFGGGLALLVTARLFRLINPNRDRSGKR
jgi:hypothetical protein